MGISNIIALLSGVSLFLFGMSLMGDGLKKCAGNQLERFLYKLTNTTWKSVLLGTGVTTVIQSSSATSVMVVGFVNSNMMKLKQAIGIVLGAILGTSITGWVLCLSNLQGGSGWVKLISTSTLTGVVAVAGIVIRMVSKKNVMVNVADIMLGFAILMFGMSTMSGSVAPLKESEFFINAMTAFSNPLLGILLGAAFTAVIQSSSAAVGILQALTITGAITFEVSLPLIMGISIGAAVPVLLSAVGANTNGKRTAFSYLVIELIGTVICGVVFYALNAAFQFAIMDLSMTYVRIALLNTVFRLATLVVLFPLIGQLEKIMCTLIKEPKEVPAAKEDDFIQTEDRFLPYPSLAVAQCRELMDRVAQVANDSVTASFESLDNWSENSFQIISDLEAKSDLYEDRISTYLMKITRYELNEKQNTEVAKYLHTLSDFERISDHALNIAEIAGENHKNQIAFSSWGRHDLKVIEDAILEIMGLTMKAFSNDDVETALRVEPLEKVVDILCNDAKIWHMNRMHKGECTFEHGIIFNDLLTNYERISDHCSNIALTVIELGVDALNTHEYIRNMDKENSEPFATWFKEYMTKFSLKNNEPLQ